MRQARLRLTHVLVLNATIHQREKKIICTLCYEIFGKVSTLTLGLLSRASPRANIEEHRSRSVQRSKTRGYEQLIGVKVIIAIEISERGLE